jgi:uncharacterized repeat protein (TIGR01451 family)
MKGNRTMKQNSIPDRVSRPALMLALPLILLALVTLGVTIQAIGGPFDNGGPFAASSVVPTVDEVSVGQNVGFALYVVNSSPVTATDVLVWNPLPPGSTYVSASGGAFPVVGGAVNDGPLAAPPEGYAYDARLHISTPLTGTDEVSGIAWVGDVRPDEMVVLGLIVAVDNPAGRFLVDEVSVYDDRELAGQFSGQTWVPPHEMFLTLILSHFEAPVPTPTPVPTATTTTVTFTIPYGQGLAIGGGSVDEDYWQALAGSDLNFGDDNTFLGQSPPNGPYIPWYLIARLYAGWDTSALPDDVEVLSAILVLEVGCNPPETAFGVTVYRGLWVPPLSENAWYTGANEPVGFWNTANYPCTGHVGSGQVLIELDPRAANREGLTLIEVRSDGEGTPPTTYEMIRVARSPGFPALVITYREEP